MKERKRNLIERLEDRFLYAADWQNTVNRLDANSSGYVEPADTHKLNFDILADSDKRVTTAYGALTEINNTPIAKRTTFIIGIDGTVKKIFTDVDVLIHGEEVVDALQAGVR
jgi:alkyl hydroperoxide reductase subunit AhpC